MLTGQDKMVTGYMDDTEAYLRTLEVIEGRYGLFPEVLQRQWPQGNTSVPVKARCEF